MLRKHILIVCNAKQVIEELIQRRLFCLDGFAGEGKIVRTAHLLENVPGKITMTAAGPTRSFGPPEPGLLYEEPLPEVNVDHRNYFEHFLKAFNGEEDIIIKPEQVRRVLCVMDAVRESAKTGKAIAFEE